VAPVLRAFLALAASLVIVAASVGFDTPAAQAAPRVSITVKDKPSLSGVADSTYLTEVTVSGSGFQSVQNGFGGIYVLFGWANPSTWKPSAGGRTGSDYRYVYDDETNPVGYQLFVSFPGSSTGYANNGGYLKANGTFSATMKIPGPVFEAYNRSGAVTSVDCVKTQCGIMTIGAHGIVNAKNETFTPLSFQKIYSAADGRPSAQAAAAPNTAVAPTIIGGRPATIPVAVDEAKLDEESSGDVAAAVGETRLTVTVPGADPDSWVGVYLYSEPLFAGWFKPNSEGVIDVDLPANLAAGEHRAVVYGTTGGLMGWAPFELASAATPEPVAATPAAAVSTDDGPLLIAAIVVGILALAAIALLVVAVLRRRRLSA